MRWIPRIVPRRETEQLAEFPTEARFAPRIRACIVSMLPLRSVAADAVELHTGQYADARGDAQQLELQRLLDSAAGIVGLGMQLNAGHGLNYRNVQPVARINGMHELNIGHAIVSRAVMLGLERAVRDMKRLIVG